MAQLSQAQKNQLKALMKDFKRLQSRLQAIHNKTGYEDLAHGVLALEIAEHTVEETFEHTGLGGEIQRQTKPRCTQKGQRMAQRGKQTCECKPGSFLKLIRVRIWKPL